MSKNAANWSRIRTGDAPGVVLAVDFYGTGRQEATFRHLCDLLPDPVEVWHAVPPTPDGNWSAATGADHLRWWTEGLDTVLAGRPVRALVGYCAGSVFASALADTLTAREGHRPQVVLFNPGAPGVATLTRDFRSLIDGMDVLTDEERAGLLAEMTAIRQAYAPNALVPVAEQYAALYRKGCDLLCERLGVDASLAAELATVLHSYLAYLTAALDVPPAPQWRTATSLTSREHRGADFTDTEHGFDIARADLLNSPQVAAALAALLREHEASR
ncbi:hypothetical protein ACFT7S_13605 [Streptomyces sp. NPDC057136]|uniref:hypothetical protein n=1 Tax=Streptomyces sp. NPDC057136 TaxID=3346029 RepID=UPI00362F386B